MRTTLAIFSERLLARSDVAPSSDTHVGERSTEDAKKVVQAMQRSSDEAVKLVANVPSAEDEATLDSVRVQLKA